jgi:hypothetical protein
MYCNWKPLRVHVENCEFAGWLHRSLKACGVRSLSIVNLRDYLPDCDNAENMSLEEKCRWLAQMTNSTFRQIGERISFRTKSSEGRHASFVPATA